MGTIVNILIGAIVTTLTLKIMATLDQVKQLLATQSQTIDEISADLEELKTKVENSGMNTEDEAELVSLIETANAKLRTVADVYTPEPVTPPVEPTPNQPSQPQEPVEPPVIQPEEPTTPPVVNPGTPINPEGPVNPENPTNPDQL